MNPTASVQVEGLLKTFGDFVAVDHVSFHVEPGEIFGFLGSNGAGKSTTIRMLCGLLRPTAGQARVQDLDVYTQTEQIKQNIGYMSQTFSLYDELTVEENISFFAGIYGIPRRARPPLLQEILYKTGLTERHDTLTALLPGGWKQRLALGCAILHKPPILFLDEPTSGVDPIARRQFWEWIYQLSEEGHTVFVTTHYMDEAEYCHRLALMHAGRIIALDTPQALRRNPRLDHFLQLDAANALGSLETLEPLPEILDIAPFGGGLRIRVPDPARAEPAIAQALQAKGIQVRSLRVVEPSMEDVFTTLIQEEERKS